MFQQTENGVTSRIHFPSLYIEYCIDQLDRTEAQSNTNNLSNNEKDVLRSSLIFNKHLSIYATSKDILDDANIL